jgi:MAM domain, meprin/A5/mu
VSDQTATTAQLSWTAVTGATGYNWEVVPQGNGQGTGVVSSGNTNNTTVQATGLAALTSYDAYLQNDCGSPYTGPVTFTTECNAVTTFPWTEGFENGGTIPGCWSQVYESGTHNWVFQNGGDAGSPSAAHTGGYNAAFLHTTIGTKTKLVSPPLDLTAITNPELNFWHTQSDWRGDQDELRVYYKTSPGGAWTLIPGAEWTVIPGAEWTVNITSWTREIFVLPNPSSNYYIAFEGTDGYGYGVCIDDITVYEPSCPTPTTQTYSNRTTTGADLGWTDATGLQWDLYIVPTGDPAPVAVSTPTINDTQNNPYTWTGGTEDTYYDW